MWFWIEFLDGGQLTEECARNVKWVFRMVMTCLIDRIYRGYYTVARRHEFYFRVGKQYFTNKRSE